MDIVPGETADRYHLGASVQPGHPAGPLEGSIIARTDDAANPQFQIPIYGIVK